MNDKQIIKKLTEELELALGENKKLKEQRDNLIDDIEKEVSASVKAPFRPHIAGVFAVIKTKLN